MQTSRSRSEGGAPVMVTRQYEQPDGEARLAIWLSLVRRLFGPQAGLAAVEPLKRSAVSSIVYRLQVTGAGPAGSLTLIAKQTTAAWADDDDGPPREATFMRLLGHRLTIPQPRVHFAGSFDETGGWLTLVDDVSADYAFPDADHCWTPAELRPILSTYAAFHARGTAVLPELADHAWLFPPYRSRVVRRAGELPENVEALVTAGIWQPLPGLGRLIEATVRNLDEVATPDTLVHNDVTPANAGLPRNGRGAALLVDWEMVGTGPAELDLAYMFAQPFDNTRLIDRPAALDWYWQERRRREGRVPTPAARDHAQRQADALLALWLIPVAHTRLLTPFPEGTVPRRYWDAMSGVLERQLRKLSAP